MSSAQQSAQHSTAGSSRWEAFRSASSLRRLGTFWTTRDTEGEDAHAVVADFAQADAEEERSPGLPWVQLEALFGQSVQDLGLETVDPDGDDNSPLAMKWSRDNIRRLIDAFGLRAIDSENEDGMSLVHLTLMLGQLKCAKQLFDYAAEQGVYVSLCWRNGDILGWALDNNWRRLADFVLQQMTEQCSSPKQTAECLRDYFGRLVKQFPQVMQKYIANDKFCFEYGRFDVPQSLFEDRPDVPIAVLDAAPRSWRPPEGSDEVKNFWKEKGFSDFIDLDSTSDAKVSAVSKFLCIDLFETHDQQMIVQSLLSANYPVEVFRTQFIKNFVAWRWNLRVRGVAVIALISDLLALALFFLFVAIVWNEGPDYSGRERELVFRAAFAAGVTKSFSTTLELLDSVLLMSLWATAIISTRWPEQPNTELFRFATSLQCIAWLFTLARDLRPFRITGPFVSMIVYVLMDIRPFIVLGTLMIVTFGAAFRVLFADLTDEDDGQSFKTLWLSFESSFHATLGQFESEALRASPASWFTIWRSLLFNLFLFLATIVLLSLLIAVLGDTCDKVIRTREAESIRSRATRLTCRTFAELMDVAGPLCGRRTNYVLRFVLLVELCYFILFPVSNAVFSAKLSVAVVPALSVLVVGMMAALAMKRNISFEQLSASDPVFLRLNSNQIDSGISVFWFLVPVISSTPTHGSSWEGRLIAMSKLVSERLKKSEETHENNSARLEASLQQRMQQMEDRLARIEGFLKKTTQSASQSNERSS